MEIYILLSTVAKVSQILWSMFILMHRRTNLGLVLFLKSLSVHLALIFKNEKKSVKVVTITICHPTDLKMEFQDQSNYT